MFGKSLLIVSTLCLAALHGVASAQGLEGGAHYSVSHGHANTGGGSYGDRNRGGPYGFYSYPRSRHVDGDSGGSLDRPLSGLSSGTSPYDNTHGSAYYGRDYGAPYNGGGYYDQGVYYRERRD